VRRSCISLIAFLTGVAAAVGPLRAGEGITVGEEQVLLEDGPGKGLQATPAVAFGKNVYLAVWREGWHGEGGKARIYASRIGKDGKPLDSKEIEIAPSEKGVQTQPRVAFGGGVFLIVWQDLRNGKDYDIFAARVSPEGKVLDAQPISVAVAPRTQALPDVSSDGKSFVVVWQGLKGNETKYRGYAACVGADGRVSPPVETAGGTPQPRIAWGGEHYLVAFGDGILASLRLGPAGKPLDPKLNPKRNPWDGQLVRHCKQPLPSIAGSSGTGWLVVAHRSAPDYWGWGGPGAMRCYLVGPDGKRDPGIKIEPSGVRTQSNWLDIGLSKKAGATWPMGESAVAWDGKQFVVVWQRHHIEKQVMFTNCDLIASRVDGFKPLDPDGVAVATSAEEEKKPALASDGAGKLLCVYERYGKDGRVQICARALATQ